MRTRIGPERSLRNRKFLGPDTHYYIIHEYDTNETRIIFNYKSSKPEVIDQFWDRHRYYFNLSESDLETHKALLESVKFGDTFFRLNFTGGPIWERVYSDAGQIIFNDTSSANWNIIDYESGAHEKYVWAVDITQYVPYEDDSVLRVRLKIDADSDIMLWIMTDSSGKLTRLRARDGLGLTFFR